MTNTSEQTADRIRRSTASFSDALTENEYRIHYLDADRKQYVLAVAVAVIAMLVFIRSDRMLFGASLTFTFLLGLRASFSLLSAAVIFILLKMRKPAMIDVLMFAWGLLYFLAVVIIYATRPPEFVRSAYLDILMLMVPYLLFNIRFWLQITPQLLYSALSLIMLSSNPSVPAVTMNAMVITYIFSNIMGIIVAWRFHVYRRQQFSRYLREKRLNRELKEAMGNLRILRGLMPICSRCKKIRDEEGYWKRLEEYIEQHSEAQFSHSLCDKCANELYGTHAWFKK